MEAFWLHMAVGSNSLSVYARQPLPATVAQRDVGPTLAANVVNYHHGIFCLRFPYFNRAKYSILKSLIMAEESLPPPNHHHHHHHM